MHDLIHWSLEQWTTNFAHNDASVSICQIVNIHTIILHKIILKLKHPTILKTYKIINNIIYHIYTI